MEGWGVGRRGTLGKSNRFCQEDLIRMRDRERVACMQAFTVLFAIPDMQTQSMKCKEEKTLNLTFKHDTSPFAPAGTRQPFTKKAIREPRLWMRSKEVANS